MVDEPNSNISSKKEENVIDSLKKNVKKLLPRRIEFVLAKTAVGAKSRSVGDEIYTRKEEEKKEVISKTEQNENEELSLFKKAKVKGRFGDPSPQEQSTEKESKSSLVTASKTTQLVSNSARDWLNLPKRQFANPEPDTKPKRVVSKPLPSADEVNGVEEKKSVKEVTKSKSNENVRKVFTEMMEKTKSEKKLNSDDLEWGDQKMDFVDQIDSSRREVLKEWEEMRKPDEWDMALDQGKTKKVRKNKLANKRHRKSNPFQEMAQKKQKKSF